LSAGDPALSRVRIGILGGTFNPPHLGHLVCAQEAWLALGLDRVLLVPASRPPHKPVEDEPGVEHRLELCRLAVEGDPRLEVSELEVRRAGPSYTVDTLSELHSTAPDNDLFLIVGGDIAAGLRDWHEPERVLALATLAVAKRRGTPRTTVAAALAHLKGGERTRFFRMPRIGVSSTLVRERARADLPIRYLVPEPVAGYIADQGLYR
jgi:nicotinate-nucleotide adenylyltransferase